MIELLFRRAALLQTQGHFERAIQDYERLLNTPRDRVFQSIDASIIGYKLHHNLAVCLHELGHCDRATKSWETAVQLNPHFIPSWLCLRQDAEKDRDSNRVACLLKRLPAGSFYEPIRHLLKASKYRLEGRTDLAFESLQAGWRDHGSTDCLDELAGLAVAKGDWQTALELLRKLAKLRPNDAAVLHNVGLAYLELGFAAEATRAVRLSLAIRPDAFHTRQLLSRLNATNDLPLAESEVHLANLGVCEE